ncbi:aspartate aminotransferase family protein [Sphingomonas sp. RB56-2]|uniref:Aspartate aminotransferase family protein n=1 Tax=Sphingomonas brevis TaxID=2908206 RepID=A0ABT0S9I7_9SPHN|nr:aspartate aminotransferase family protein [Sphingomonas brevis]MCL6740997.1 aspartate aminotransferase family protein [Sphingomonas brevis]
MEAEHVFHRSTEARPPLAVRGEGIYVIDDRGGRYVDACGGAAVSCLGHGHPAVVAAMAEQARRLEYVHTGFFTTEAAEELAADIAGQCPGTLDRVWFTGSGSEAIEAALKLARQYYLERGDSGRSKVIARRLSYHGNTLGALAAGGSAWRRKPYEPLLIDVSLVDPCFEYRFAEPGESAEAYGERAANRLEQEILEIGPDRVMAFVAETVVGATAGAVPPVPDYLRRIREICDRHGMLLILDEVMCGSGRTGTFLSCEQDGVVPDIVTLGKGLGAGYEPIAAAVCSSEVYDAVATGSGALKHGQTYNAHVIGCAAALAVQRVIREERLLPRVRQSGERLMDLLGQSFGQHSNVGDIRGRGLLIALELVADRATKAPFDAALAIHQRAKAEAFARGLLIYPSGGTVDGRSGDHILLAPPYNVSDGELDMIVDLLGQTIDAVLPS